MQTRRKFSCKAAGKFLGLAPVFALALASAPSAIAQTVETVPWVEATPASPHTAIASTPIVLGAVFIRPSGSADTYVYQWSYGDGTSDATTTPVPAAYGGSSDIHATHTYAGTTIGQTFYAKVTVTDTTTVPNQQYTATYYVIWEDQNVLQSRVNVAIDWGLWFLHASMYHPTGATGNWSGGCAPGYGAGYACGNGYGGSLTATNVQAFEVNGHQATGAGSSTDPYATDVSEGLAYIFANLASTGNAANTYYFDPATYTFGCSDGSQPSYSYASNGYCQAPATQVFYNPHATSCPGGYYDWNNGNIKQGCSYTFDGNKNGLMVYAPNYQNMGYEQGMFADAIVASANPTAIASTTPSQITNPALITSGSPATGPAGIAGQSYLNIVQDMVDWAGYCQYEYDEDVQYGYTRGGGYSAQGGGWLYTCQSGDDNSTSQWAAVGLIAAERGFGLTIPTMVTDANQLWVTNAEDVVAAKPTGKDSFAAGGDYGGFGYRGSLSGSPEWGPFAVTPSGMVQMALDGVGRTKNTAFGDSTTDADQRWNNVETFYADNFCNDPANGAYYSPKAYTYGLFSFTKSMLLHDPGFSLSSIQYLRTQTSGVFSSTNPNTPANTIDWYGAVQTGHFNGTDTCDGVAQTLVGRQNAAGFWYGDNYYGSQNPYETAWSLIMLQRTVFVQCVNNLAAVGTPGTSLTPTRVDVSWTAIPNVSGYNILRSTTNGSGYTQVPYNGGFTNQTSFMDVGDGLTNGSTYYYVIEPVNANGSEVCQSNQAKVTVPKSGAR
jgi:hypothetical protein